MAEESKVPMKGNAQIPKPRAKTAEYKRMGNKPGQKYGQNPFKGSKGSK